MDDGGGKGWCDDGRVISLVQVAPARRSRREKISFRIEIPFNGPPPIKSIAIHTAQSLENDDLSSSFLESFFSIVYERSNIELETESLALEKKIVGR